MTAASRFWAKTERDGEHVLWMGGDQFWLAPGRVVSPVRAAWLLTRGPVPDGLVPARACKTLGCVAHLKAVRNGRQRSKLTVDQVREIRAMPRGSLSVRELAKRLGVCRETIRSLRRADVSIWEDAR